MVSRCLLPVSTSEGQISQATTTLQQGVVSGTKLEDSMIYHFGEGSQNHMIILRAGVALCSEACFRGCKLDPPSNASDPALHGKRIVCSGQILCFVPFFLHNRRCNLSQTMPLSCNSMHNSMPSFVSPSCQHMCLAQGTQTHCNAHCPFAQPLWLTQEDYTSPARTGHA